MKKFGLLGKTLKHSYSKIIQEKTAVLFDEEIEYSLLEVEPNELPSKLDLLKKGVYSGFNVTIPYKKEIIKYLDELSSEAQSIGAVNVVKYENNKLVGYNTDYFGFLETLRVNNICVKGQDTYVLGTGGAAFCLHKVLEDEGSKNVFYVSRNKTQNSNTISYSDLDKLENIFLVANATPVGMWPNIDASPLKESTVKKVQNVIDIIFNPTVTKLMSYADTKINGAYMLYVQAIYAQKIWFDKPISFDIKNIYDKLIKEVFYE